MVNEGKKTAASDLKSGVHGYCNVCKKDHFLPSGNSKNLSVELMIQLEKKKHINLFSQTPAAQCHSTEPLFGDSRGKMFGVLEGVDNRGIITTLYAFSGQFNGLWNVPGWAPPLFDEEIWNDTNCATEKDIKNLGKKLAGLHKESPEYIHLSRLRRKLSQELMNRIHSLYVLKNFKGECSTLNDFFPLKKGIPTGTGDCCAPKLLNHARQLDLTPIGITEFYWGRTNKSNSRVHRAFYPACTDKCKPILGFLLCGTEEMQRKIMISR